MTTGQTHQQTHGCHWMSINSYSTFIFCLIIPLRQWEGTEFSSAPLCLKEGWTTKTTPDKNLSNWFLLPCSSISQSSSEIQFTDSFTWILFWTFMNNSASLRVKNTIAFRPYHFIFNNTSPLHTHFTPLRLSQIYWAPVLWDEIWHHELQSKDILLQIQKLSHEPHKAVKKPE